MNELTEDGAGVVEIEGRAYAIDGVLPGELIEFELRGKRRSRVGNLRRGILQRVIEPSPERVEPRCRYFGVCGGCARQHTAPAVQLAFKEKILFDHLAKTAGVEPQQKLKPVQASLWNYRRKARPGIRYVPKKGGILVGFRERNHRYITSLMHCHTLDARLSALLPELHELLAQIDCPNAIPQIEMAAADNAVALVLRNLQALTDADIALLTRFAEARELQLFLQSGGPDTVKPLWPKAPEPLYYRLDHYDLNLRFLPTDFIQVNGEVNALMIRLAMDLLKPDGGDSVVDLFCGIGNFTLPIARSGARVLGIEGDPGLTRRGAENAALNGLANAEFRCMDLYQQTINPQPPGQWLDKARFDKTKFNKALLDPPRSGAAEVVKQLIPAIAPQVIVYVSCNPATLARDANMLLHEHGYQLTHAGVVDMFPHTARVESIARFER